MSVCCHKATAFRDMKRRSIPRAFKKRQNFFIWGNLNDEFEGCVKKTQCSPHRGLLGNMEGVRFMGFFDRERKCIFRFFCLGPEEIKS